MDTPEEKQLSPLYRYDTEVWVSRKYKLVAENDEALEDAVQEALQNDGLDPSTFQMIRLETTRTPILWQ